MSFNTEAIQGSYGRCLRSKGFISRFYELLQEQDARIPGLFEETDWTKQNKALRRGISIALTFAGGSNIVQGSMDQMADVHSRSGRAPVDPVLYKHWRNSLLQAVEENDPRATPELMADWEKALKMTTDYFTQHY